MSYQQNARKFEKFDPTVDHEKQLQFILETNDWGDEELQKKLFLDVMGKIDSAKPSLIELGSGGTDSSVYSLVFEKFNNYNCTIVNTEPRKELLDLIESEWRPNHLRDAILCHGYNGSGQTLAAFGIDVGATPKIKVIDIMKHNNLDKVDILHMDIQGEEIFVLEEMENDGTIGKVRFFFISTHNSLTGQNIHERCLETIDRNLKPLYYFSDTHSGGYGDGLIVFENLNF